jgi:hypothetical protein
VIIAQLAALLRERGHEVETSFGQSDFRYDVAVRPPSERRHWLGIIVDTGIP